MSPIDLPRVAYIASPELAKVASLLPSNRRRSAVVHALVNALGLLAPNFSSTRRLQLIAPRRATRRDLENYHSRDYLDYVLSSQRVESNSVIANAEFGLEDDCPPFTGLSDYVQLVGGATLTAAAVLKNDIADIAICWDGGRHHARKSNASGFCYVADCILALLALKRPSPEDPLGPVPVVAGRRPSVMYIDLDLHFGDAVFEAFSSQNSCPPQILTLSIHHAAPGFFPASPQGQLPDPASPSFNPFALSLPLREGASSSAYARVWPLVERVKDAFSPDFIIIQCGVDGLAGDPCSTFNWCLSGLGSLGWCVQNINGWKGRKLFLGGGGYNSTNAARAWSYLTSIIVIKLDNPIDLDMPVPDHIGFPLYAPSFTLDVPPGNMHDHNTEEYLKSIEECYTRIIEILQRCMNMPKP